MCVLLCVNSSVRSRLNAVVIRWEREALQLSAAFPPPSPVSAGDDDAHETIEEHVLQKIPRGSMLREYKPSSGAGGNPFCPVERRVPANFEGRLFNERKNALNAFAHAWSRLLGLFGWHG